MTELKVRWVLGYDTLQLNVAMEQGEVQGRVNDAASMMTDKSEWFANREIVALLAMTLPAELPPVKHPMFEGIPSIMQFAKTDVQKNIIQKINSTGRLGAALAFPPGTPEAIRGIMEEALLKEARIRRLEKIGKSWFWKDLRSSRCFPAKRFSKT